MCLFAASCAAGCLCGEERMSLFGFRCVGDYVDRWYLMGSASRIHWHVG